MRLIISDDHAGLRAACTAVFGGIPWQRCQFQLQQNAQAYVPFKAIQKEVAGRIRAIFQAPDRTTAERYLAEAVADYQKRAPKLAAWMEINLAEHHVIGRGDQLLPYARGQALGRGQGPEEDVCVQEQAHYPSPSNVARTSSGRGVSKSSGTVRRPRSKPRRREDWRGTNRATGRPARAMITSSPPSTSSTSLEGGWGVANQVGQIILHRAS